MLTKFIGKGRMILEYDGKKYIFYSQEVKDIPVKVYDYLKSSRDIRSTELIPYEPPIEEEVVTLIPKKQQIVKERQKPIKPKKRKR